MHRRCCRCWNGCSLIAAWWRTGSLASPWASWRVTARLRSCPVWSEPPQTPAMAMGGLVGKRLDQLLNEMVKAGIELPVKMVITPHNESWPFGRLIEEVSREHALFMEMERLKKLTDRAHRRLEQQEEQTLREAARQAKDLLARMRLQDDRQPTHEQLSGAADRLQQLLDKM